MIDNENANTADTHTQSVNQTHNETTNQVIELAQTNSPILVEAEPEVQNQTSNVNIQAPNIILSNQFSTISDHTLHKIANQFKARIKNRKRLGHGRFD